MCETSVILFDISFNFSVFQLFRIIASNALIKTIRLSETTSVNAIFTSPFQFAQLFTSIKATKDGTAYDIASAGFT